MAGICVPILEKTRLEYSYLGNTSSQVIIFERAINVSSFYWVQLIVRVHERSMSTGQSITFSLVNTLPSLRDSREFSETTDFVNVAVTGASAGPSPAVVPGMVSVSGTMPQAFLKFQATVLQSTGGTTLYAEVSAALVLRES